MDTARMLTFGDITRPRVYCKKCGMILYCDKRMRGTLPETARRKLRKAHGDCDGEIEYAAGLILAHERPHGMEV